ncbi:hypothetical protein HN385_01460 [archaeon]|jgi:pyruvate kinase|nr:hypothetical protein [archaeon]MBT3451321.1 hypothetical protein [archaeon]MBT6869363.1 hypothetical protein [archaeon]MBT7192526.1 hypothetical protein [archaeon]MBT7380602.1 hypothetical protein [archaeon]
MVKAIVTIPPYAPFIEEVVNHPIVSGLRLNTVMPTKGSLEELLKQLQDKANGKDLWIDLKYRQLRVKNYGIPPFTEIELTHNIDVDTPVTAYFSDGKERAKILEVDGNRLIMQDGPKRMVGPGESINIVHPSLNVEGHFTKTDLKYIEAAEKVGLKTYMLSFVESVDDVTRLKEKVSDAIIVAKIESQKGMGYVRNVWKDESRLMAARGDLFVELEMPHYVTKAVEEIVMKDNNAIVASRIFPSLSYSLEPSCNDIGDVDNLIRMGYQNFMLGDDICMKRDSVISGLNLLKAIADNYYK